MLINESVANSTIGFNLDNEIEEGKIYADIPNFLNIIKAKNRLPLDKVEVYYSDDLWDFNGITVNNINRSLLRFNFSKCQKSFVEELKDFVLLSILESRIKTNTVYHNFIILIQFANYLHEHGCFQFRDIISKDISDYILSVRERGASEHSVLATSNAIRNLLNIFESNSICSFDKGCYNALNDIDKNVLEAEKHAGKTLDIPKEFFNNFMKASLEVVKDEDAPKLIRAIAAIYLILSQTGLRIGELLALKVGSLSETRILDGETAYFLNYRVWKPAKTDSGYLIVRTYINEIAKCGYDILVELYKEERAKYELEYLFLGSTEKDSLVHNLPIDSSKMSKYSLKYFYYLNKYFPTVSQSESTNPALPSCPYPSYKTKPENRVYVTVPHARQFRVHVCTELYNKGVNIKYISEFMSHLTSEMTAYYIRPKRKVQEDREMAISTLKRIVTGEAKPIGKDDGLVEKINTFIEENGYNVEKNLEEICEKLADKIPIRQKTGGFCIKSSKFRECSIDAQTNEFYCAYGVCPNIYGFYYTADVTYRQIKELRETIGINQKRGLVKQVQKEKGMLQSIIQRRFIPELDELKKVVNKKGIIPVLEDFPELQYLIENMDSVYEEVSLWLENL